MDTSRERTSVLIGGVDCDISYTMHSVKLYKERTGDSLLDRRTWEVIHTTLDPDRWLTCLWVGLHQEQSEGSWKAPYTLEELSDLVGIGDVARITSVMSKAMALDLGWIIKAVTERAELEALVEFLERVSKGRSN